MNEMKQHHVERKYTIERLMIELKNTVAEYTQFQQQPNSWEFVGSTVDHIQKEMCSFMNRKAQQECSERTHGGNIPVVQKIFVNRRPMYAHADVLFYIADDSNVHHYVIHPHQIKISEHL